MTQQQQQDKKFRNWLRTQLVDKVQDARVRERMITYAWDNGHVNGYNEVTYILEDLYQIFSGELLYLDNLPDSF